MYLVPLNMWRTKSWIWIWGQLTKDKGYWANQPPVSSQGNPDSFVALPSCPETTCFLGKSLRTRLPELIPKILAPSVYPPGCCGLIALADAELRPLNHIGSCRRQTWDRCRPIPFLTPHQDMAALILWIRNLCREDGSVAPRTFCRVLKIASFGQVNPIHS